MKKPIIIICSLFLSLSSVTLLHAQVDTNEDELEIVVGPYLQAVTQNSISIMWETNIPSNSIVEYAKPLEHIQSDEPELTYEVTDSDPCNIHEIVVKNLSAQSKYFYRVGSATSNSKVYSGIYSFKTAVRKNSPFSFVVLGDNRSFPKRWNKITDLAYAERPDFVLHVGDVLTNGNIKQQWIDEYLKPAQTLMKYTPLYVAIGNHERNSKWYYRYSSYPKPENYYSFKYGNAEFFVIDSNKKLDAKSKQYKWLEQKLAACQAKWKFVAHHHPPYCSDENDYGDTKKELSTRGDLNARKLVPLYEKYNVDIVWCGHIHDYERTLPIRDGKVTKDGVIYILAGGGAASLEHFAAHRSWFTAKVHRNWQFCLINIYNSTLEMKAYNIDGNMYDFLKLQK